MPMHRRSTQRRRCSKVPRPFACPIAPPPQLVVAPECFLPAEQHKRTQQAEAELAFPPPARRYSLCFQGRPQGADRILLGVGQPRRVDRQVPAELEAYGSLAAVRPVEQCDASVGVYSKVAELPITVQESERGR